MRRYAIAIRGFDSEMFIAENASKAKAACYRALREAGYLTHTQTRFGCGPFAFFLSQIDYVYAMGEAA